MTEHKNLTAALIAAQAAFGDLKKDKTVKVNTKDGRNYSYTYADLGSTLDAVLPALHANGLALVQPMAVRDGKAGIITRILHESGETLEGWTPIVASGQDAQSFGSGITYARRYGLTALLCLAAEDDDGQAASTPVPVKQEPSPVSGNPVNAESGEVDELAGLRKRLYATAKAAPLNHTDEQIKTYLFTEFNVDSSKQMSEDQLNTAIRHYTALKNQKVRQESIT